MNKLIKSVILCINVLFLTLSTKAQYSTPVIMGVSTSTWTMGGNILDPVPSNFFAQVWDIGHTYTSNWTYIGPIQTCLSTSWQPFTHSLPNAPQCSGQVVTNSSTGVITVRQGYILRYVKTNNQYWDGEEYAGAFEIWNSNASVWSDWFIQPPSGCMVCDKYLDWTTKDGAYIVTIGTYSTIAASLFPGLPIYFP